MDDKVIANVIKGLPKADWKEREKVANALDAYILKRSIDAPLRDLLRTSLSLLSNFRHESKRRPVEEYERLIKTLLDLGYSQVASAIFSNCYSSISPLLEDSMMAIIPTVKDVNLWIKESNADKSLVCGRSMRSGPHPRERKFAGTRSHQRRGQGALPAALRRVSRRAR